MPKLRPKSYQSHGVKQIIERMLDKGVVINAKIRAYLVDFKLIELESIVVLASFETAAKIGVSFPKGIDFETKAWKELLTKETCPQCRKKVYEEELRLGCPWCSYKLGG
ncbi:MAG: gas vesicle protein [Candidatus Diapherotrites archaeon]